MIVTKRRVCKQACKKGQSGQKQKNGSGRTLDDVSSCSLEIDRVLIQNGIFEEALNEQNLFR